MANMSYCRFKNTLGDLQDCEEALDTKAPEELSESEQDARVGLVRLCVMIAIEHGYEVGSPVDPRGENS